MKWLMEYSEAIDGPWAPVESIEAGRDWNDFVDKFEAAHEGAPLTGFYRWTPPDASVGWTTDEWTVEGFPRHPTS